MNDRELLELAAKAAGIVGTSVTTLGGVPAIRINPHDLTPWNPIEDDGDALRLAVNVGVVVATYGAHVRIYTPYSEMLALEAKDQDPNYATRRAIVRAAAEIGRQMEVA